MNDFRNSKFNKANQNPFRSLMKDWYPNSKKLFYIKEKWADIVGKEISQNTQLIGMYDNGFLSVACRSSSWSSELNLRKKQIIKKINLIFGPDYVTKINFSTAKYINRDPVKSQEKPKIEIELSQEKLDEIEKKVGIIEDEALKNKIRQVYINFAKSELREKYEKN